MLCVRVFDKVDLREPACRQTGVGIQIIVPKAFGIVGFKKFSISQKEVYKKGPKHHASGLFIL